MRKVILTKNVYSYEELSETAKMNVRQQTAETSTFYYDELIDSIKEICKYTGLKTGNRWDNVYNTVDNLTGIRAYKYIYNNFIYPNKKPKTLKYSDKKRRFIYSKLQVEYECNFTGVCYDYILWDAWKDFKQYLKTDKNISIDDFCHILSGKIKQEFEGIEEYIYSDEYAQETSDANNYEYDENGNIFKE
jgi:hypothetical protein